MTFDTHIPRPPLSDFVELFWHYEGPETPGHEKERCLPTGTFELVINLRKDELRIYDREDTERFRSYRGALISGAQSRHFVIDTESQGSILGVHFKPGGAFPFLGLPAGELHDRQLSLETLWRAGADEMRGRLLEAATPGARFRVLERCLLDRMSRSPNRHPAVAFALGQFHRPCAPTVAEVTDRLGLSARRFIQVFQDQVGLTPKRYCRIRRFQIALRLLGPASRGSDTRSAPRIDWADLALSCGYFDQSHLIRDFRAFSGLSPTAYAARRTEHRNHVPLPV